VVLHRRYRAADIRKDSPAGRRFTMQTEAVPRERQSLYADLIRQSLERQGLKGDVRYVEAYMRLEHGTLDGLEVGCFDNEVAVAAQAAILDGEAAAMKLAVTYGLIRPEKPAVKLVCVRCDATDDDDNGGQCITYESGPGCSANPSGSIAFNHGAHLFVEASS
jgi:hypothetical protein